MRRGAGGREGTIGLVRLVALAGLAGALALPASAAASPVLVLGPDGARSTDDPFLPADAGDPPPEPVATAPRPRARGSARTVDGELRRLERAGAIDAAEADRRRASWRRANRSLRALRGARRRELGAVVANLRGIAARGQLTSSRLPALFLTLDRNRRWWTAGPLLACAQRVEFVGSPLVWQYYPGQGIQLQVLANFGKANAYWSTGRHDAELRQLLGELVPLAARRAGGLAWEYHFAFSGGRPPWASALAQGTALQALARGAQRLGDPALMEAGRQGLALFRRSPPTGVRVRAGSGAHYLIYSFAPGLRVLNGFLQALVGLHDFATLSGDPLARRLFEAGDARARREVPRYDTGRWSLYTLGRQSDLNYHRLVRDFLRSLCSRTRTGVYCRTADRFTRYLSNPPASTRGDRIGCSPQPRPLRLSP